MRCFVSSGLFVLSLLAASGAGAQGLLPSRAARVMSLGADQPGVWLGPRRVWVPASGRFLSVCAPGRGCAPVEGEPSACEPPACPGHGVVLTAARPVASVGPLPSSYDGYQREVEAMRADPALAALAGQLSDHPEHAARAEQRAREEAARRREERRHQESVRWVSEHRDGDRWEVSLDADFGTLASEGGSYAGGTAGFGFRFLLSEDDSNERGESAILGAFFGDTFGADLRVHFLHRLDGGQRAQWIAAVGVAPALSNRFETSALRLPTFYGVVMPELGAIFRADRDPTWYVGWNVPVSLLVTHDLAVDFTARLFVVDEWIELPADAPEDADDPAEVILTLSVGARLP